MSSIHKARCHCGFNTEVTVGGLMNSFKTRAYFPYYCEPCGMVSANIALQVPICPKCGSSEINQYGKPPVSIPSDSRANTLCAWNYAANAEGNLCPSCKQMTLVFHDSHLLSD